MHTFYMKKTISIILCVTFICSGILSAKEKEEDIQKHIAEEVLRFHVKGHSDSKKDQWIKMQVKEVIVGYLEPWMKQMFQVEEAKIFVENQMPNIKKSVQETLNRYGCSYGFHMELCENCFPEKTYGDCTFPKGVYEAFVVTLGEGGGKNWWCMIYPGLCFLEDSYGIITEESKKKLENSLSEEAYNRVTEEEDRWEKEGEIEIRLRFKCVQWFEKAKEYIEETVNRNGEKT